MVRFILAEILIYNILNTGILISIRILYVKLFNEYKKVVLYFQDHNLFFFYCLNMNILVSLFHLFRDYILILKGYLSFSTILKCQ